MQSGVERVTEKKEKYNNQFILGHENKERKKIFCGLNNETEKR